VRLNETFKRNNQKCFSRDINFFKSISIGNKMSGNQWKNPVSLSLLRFVCKGKHDGGMHGFGPLQGNVRSFLGRTWKKLPPKTVRFSRKLFDNLVKIKVGLFKNLVCYKIAASVAYWYFLPICRTKDFQHNGCGHAAKQRVIAKFISNETLQSVVFACCVGTGPSPGFRSNGAKNHKGGHIFKYNIGCMQLRGSKHAKNVSYDGSTNA